MVLTKPRSWSKRGFCGFRFLPSQLLAIKDVTRLLFLQINYIFVTLRKRGLILMRALFLLRKRRKRWRDECRSPNWKGGVVQEGRNAGLLPQRFSSLCVLLPAAVGLYCVYAALLLEVIIWTRVFIIKITIIKIRVWRDLSGIRYLCLRVVYTP